MANGLTELCKRRVGISGQSNIHFSWMNEQGKVYAPQAKNDNVVIYPWEMACLVMI